MEESTNGSVILDTNNINFGDVNILTEHNAADLSSKCGYSSDDDEAPAQRVKRRIQNLSDSETEKENLHIRSQNDTILNKSGTDSDDSDSLVPPKSVKFKSRIVMNGSSSDTDEHTPAGIPTLKNKEQQMRMNNKKRKMKQKFEGLLCSRSKYAAPQNMSDRQSSEDEKIVHLNEASDNEMSSIARIKQKIKKRMAVRESIYDPESSDEESNMNNKFGLKQEKKNIQKATKIIDAKPMRMSAKQAMENMQLIKSESNRMLREKAVSLPYHRPKALTLKDIMSRRKPALTSDGRVLPIKMNEEQLKQYALQLEERQKEMMELCKSESDDDIAEPEPSEKTDNPTPNDSDNIELETNISIVEPNTVEKETSERIESNAIVDSNTNEAIDCTDTDSAKDIPIEIEVPYSMSNNLSNNGNELVDRETNQKRYIASADLVCNDNSVEENTVKENTENVCKESEIINNDKQNELHDHKDREPVSREFSEQESQLISLHYTENDSEKFKETDILGEKDNTDKLITADETLKQTGNCKNDIQDDFFSDDDVNMDDIDKIIENAEIMKDNDGNTNCLMLIKDPLKPKLAGAPGMVIDLDETNAKSKRSGVELLKERFIYFSKLKTPEELERAKEKMIKPGALHLKLKQELEDKMAEQRSLEWAKRLEDEKQHHEEMDTILDDSEEADDSIDKIKSNIEKEDDNEENPSESDADEELIENDIEMKDKPVKYNPMLDDEAEESEVEGNDEEDIGLEKSELGEDIEEGDDSESSEDEESSESEEEEQTSKHKKGRILKAFEDSDDDENSITKLVEVELPPTNTIDNKILETTQKSSNDADDTEVIINSCDIQSSSQDDVLQLAQRHKSVSEDLFTSQESSIPNITEQGIRPETSDDLLGTQTFSISSAKPENFLCPSQPYHDPIINGVADTFSQNLLGSQLVNTQSSEIPIGEDVLALCTGKFYDNEFVSSSDVPPTESNLKSISQEKHADEDFDDKSQESSVDDGRLHVGDNNKQENVSKISENDCKKADEDQNLLKSLIDELDDPELEQPKPNKFFTGAPQNKSERIESIHMKKRLVIDSDDEPNETDVVANLQKKKQKKKKLEKRALQISDDEDEEEDGSGEEDDDCVSDIEEDGERFVDYDSEENEIEVKPEKLKKKRKANDFFEQEAELTSEDEWVGSGDEDEHGLDRMEREEGDDEVFHQGKLRKELGQIHMRDVLDQDKREVRLLQELLFEDGDLGGGHRQRKFRWRNAGDEEAGTIPDDLTDTQEEEFESEEQWRKQRHERELFLRQMQNEDEGEGSPNVTINRTTIIKANLISKSMSTLLMEVNQSKTESANSTMTTEKKTVKDILSPKKSFSILQQKYHNSVLHRGRGALARLAALATPLAAGDDDVPNISSLASRKRNFVFAALTPDEDQPKVTIKRKADVKTGTPKLVKKIRLEEKQGQLRNSLLDHLNT